MLALVSMAFRAWRKPSAPRFSARTAYAGAHGADTRPTHGRDALVSAPALCDAVGNLVARQLQCRGKPATGPVTQFQFAAVQTRGIARDGQAKADATGSSTTRSFQSHIGLDYARQRVLGNAGAAVLDR
jgi:hypothetical protein